MTGPEKAQSALQARFPAQPVALVQDQEQALAAVGPRWCLTAAHEPEDHHHSTIAALVRAVPDQAQRITVFGRFWSDGRAAPWTLGVVWSRS